MVFREQALALPGIGKALADKIMEMVEDGRIRKVDEVFVIIIMIIRKVEEVCSSEKVKVLSIFSDVWGAGPKTAQAWWDRWVSLLVGRYDGSGGPLSWCQPDTVMWIIALFFQTFSLLRGFRSLDDLKGANLTRQQEVFNLSLTLCSFS